MQVAMGGDDANGQLPNPALAPFWHSPNADCLGSLGGKWCVLYCVKVLYWGRFYLGHCMRVHLGCIITPMVIYTLFIKHLALG